MLLQSLHLLHLTCPLPLLVKMTDWIKSSETSVQVKESKLDLKAVLPFLINR